MSIRYIKPKPKKSKKKYLLVILVIGLLFFGYKLYQNRGKVAENINGAANVITEPEKPKINDPAPTQEKISLFLGDSLANYSYYVYNLENNQEFGYEPEEVYTAASSIKVAFAAYIYNLAEKGKTSLSKKLTYTRADYEGGTGILIAQPYGTTYTVEQYIKLMIEKSDNAATNVLTRTYGRTNIQNYLTSLGFTGINVANNKITPKDLGTLFVKLYNDGLGIGDHKDTLITYLKNSLIETRLKGQLPVGTEVAHKIGTQTSSISDSGIVFLNGKPYVISVFTNKFVSETVANANIAGISKIVYDFYAN